jgi:hypothetical protein
MSTDLTDMLPETQRPDRGRSRLLAALAAGVAAAGIVTAVVVTSNDAATPPPVTGKTSALALAAPGGGPSMGMCIRFDVELLSKEPVAFAGTVTSVETGTVSLDVTRWYAGGTAQVVTVSTPDNSNVALEGVAFQEGKHYLVAANEGTVVSCGFSGEATAELQQAYEQAFG